jgi:hypothetical protein
MMLGLLAIGAPLDGLMIDMTIDEETHPLPCLHLLDDETWPLEASRTFLEHGVTTRVA